MSQPKERPSLETPADRHARIRTDGGRESVEAMVVAIVLALLFRAFVAEAFVIPTGSMAPTLMGAHKDVACLECGQPYRTGASIETKTLEQSLTVVGTVCPNCRSVNPLDLAGDVNHATFSGDRILVSKFAYALSDPERWDVIVFKFPGNPKQNYIKRLVGLPEETLRIQYGDVYSRPNGANEYSILRKPHHKLMAMAHHVHDTNYQSETLINAGYPSLWQPWSPGADSPPSDSWQIERSRAGWSADLKQASDSTKFLRFFHRFPSEDQWAKAASGLSLSNLDPYSSLGITDFYEYDAYVYVDASQVWEKPPGAYDPNQSFIEGILSRIRTTPGIYSKSYQSGGPLDQFSSPSIGLYGAARRGNHWVGDLIVEADVTTQDSAAGEMVLELVESALTFRCRIDLTSGQATLEIEDIDGMKTFAEAGGTATATPQADTGIYSGDSCNVRFANCDDQMYLWVDGSAIQFDQPTTYKMSALRKPEEQRPYTRPEHPYDAAPAAIGLKGVSGTISRLQVMRDKYYIATRDTSRGLNDYDLQFGANSIEDIQIAVSEPSLWDNVAIWERRRHVEFELDQDQFFPMGDNSPESQDARCWVQRLPSGSAYDKDAYIWSEVHYVPRDLLVGKALMVFWPHYWNDPIPFTPNIKRMGLIR